MIIACTCVDENIYLSLIEWERGKVCKDAYKCDAGFDTWHIYFGFGAQDYQM